MHEDTRRCTEGDAHPAGVNACRSGYRQERCLPQTQRGTERGLHRWWERRCCSSRETPPLAPSAPGSPRASVPQKRTQTQSFGAALVRGPRQDPARCRPQQEAARRGGRALVSTTVQLAQAERGPETRESLCAWPSWTDGEGAGERTLGGPRVVAVLCHPTSWP